MPSPLNFPMPSRPCVLVSGFVFCMSGLVTV